jgi:hypothetical protein
MVYSVFADMHPAAHERAVKISRKEMVGRFEKGDPTQLTH